MLWHGLLVVDLDPIIPDLVNQALLLELLLLGLGQGSHFVGHKRVFWSPVLHSCARALANQASHVDALILLVELGKHFIEIGVRLIHPRVASLAQSCILLVILDGRCL